MSITYNVPRIFAPQYSEIEVSAISPITINDHISITSNSPIVIQPPMGNYPFNNMPFQPTIDMTFAPDLVPLYENINKHPRVITRTTKYFYYKTLDKWLRATDYGIKHVLGYLDVNNGEVKLINDLSKYNEDKHLSDSKEDTNLKIKYIEEKIFSQSNLAKVLMKYADEINVNTYDLHKIEKFVRVVIGNHLSTMLKKAISNQNSTN
jgi:hypothetical protein